MTIPKSQQEAVARYNRANYDRLELRVPKGMKSTIREHVADHRDKYHDPRGNPSVNAFVLSAVQAQIDRDKAQGKA